MYAVVFESIGKIAVKEVDDPRIEAPTDAIVKINRSAICGTDLHMVRGSLGDMVPGTILGHEGVGVVEDVGNEVRNLRRGDRVVIPSSIACGYCSYCRSGYYAQCDNANPNGKQAGTAFFGGPKTSGPFNGLQAERARVPFANVGLVKLQEWISDDMAVLLSDIFPTAYFGAEMAGIKRGDVVVVLGCGPVGLLTIECCFYFGAGRVIAIDNVEDRLERAQSLGAEVINFSQENPLEVVLSLTGGIGADCVIDAVGIDAEASTNGKPRLSERKKQDYENELRRLNEESTLSTEWKHGNAPSLALEWAIEMVDKAGCISIIGVYPDKMESFPIGKAMNKNLKINMGNCHHRRYIPFLMNLIHRDIFDFSKVISQVIPFSEVINAYHSFDKKESGWVKVALSLN